MVEHRPQSPPLGPLRKLVGRILVVAALLLAIRYFAWRFTDTLNPAAVWFFWVFLAAELAGFGEVFLFYLTTWPQPKRTAPPAPVGRSVDVFIATYNEPVSLLRDTAVCALNMRYPHETWLLDDGCRAEVAQLAKELGCRYLARTDRSHAKAGNLNNALKHSSAEFIITLDADHVPMPDMIEQLLGFFGEPKVAIVQANQDFYNLDSFQHETDWGDQAAWQQQELFFNVVQPGKDAFNAAMYCGSPAMLRRSALDEIGGFATETVTEDMHTGLRLHRRGWRVVYYNRTVARGIAPQTYAAYNTQWHRWGLGAMQVLRLERPLLGPGLSLGQRVSYLASFYFYWMSVQKLFYLLVPVFCVVTGIFPLSTPPRTYLDYFLPYFLVNLLATALLQGGFMGFIRTERYNLIKLGSMVRSLAGLFGTKAAFAVTPKARGSAAPWQRLRFHFVIIALLVAAVMVGVWRVATATQSFHFWAYAVNVAFALIFLWLLVPAVRLALIRKELRTTYRFPQRLDLPVRFRLLGSGNEAWAEAFARNLNRFGLSLTLDTALPPETRLELVMRVQDREIRAEGAIRWTETFRVGRLVRVANGMRFDRISVEDQDAIARYLFWEVAPKHGELLTLTRTSQQSEAAA